MRSSCQGDPTPLCGCNDLMLITWNPSSTLCSASSFDEPMMLSNIGTNWSIRLHGPEEAPNGPVMFWYSFVWVSWFSTRNQESLSYFFTDSIGGVSGPAAGLTQRHLAMLYEEEPDQVETDTWDRTNKGEVIISELSQRYPKVEVGVGV